MPGNWEMNGVGMPIYTNIEYPFDRTGPPNMPSNIPTGLYRRKFSVPIDWLTAGKRVRVLFQGVESAFHVWVNGKFVGYNQVFKA